MEKYSFKNVSLLINGVEITGFFEGDDVIVVDRRVDSISDVVGADGKMALAINADHSGTIVFKLKQTSSSNAYLGGLIQAAEKLEFTTIFAQMRDSQRGDLAAGSEGYLMRPATMTRGAAINEQEWTVVIEDLTMLTGTG